MYSMSRVETGGVMLLKSARLMFDVKAPPLKRTRVGNISA
jgi:hypothetical protein